MACRAALARERAEKYLKQLQLWEKRKSMARALSGGMKRRLMIARALMHEPRLLILDEPTAGVDIEIRRSMWEFLREINEQGTTIILTTHYLEEAENLCRNIAIIDGGRIIERDRMGNLLRKLQTETFVLTLRNPLAAAPALRRLRRGAGGRPHAGGGDVARSRTSTTSSRGCRRAGHRGALMRNKVNRLEEMFMRLVENRSAMSTAGTAAVNDPRGRASAPSSCASSAASSASGARPSCPRRSPRRCIS